jgi:hypothetical protein
MQSRHAQAGVDIAERQRARKARGREWPRHLRARDGTCACRGDRRRARPSSPAIAARAASRGTHEPARLRGQLRDERATTRGDATLGREHRDGRERGRHEQRGRDVKQRDPRELRGEPAQQARERRRSDERATQPLTLFETQLEIGELGQLRVFGMVGAIE